MLAFSLLMQIAVVDDDAEEMEGGKAHLLFLQRENLGGNLGVDLLGTQPLNLPRM
jgi:hypothetical protein